MEKLVITYAQVMQLMPLFSDAEPDTEVALHIGDGHSGQGIYAYYEEYPEYGSIILDATELPDIDPVVDEARKIAKNSFAHYHNVMQGKTDV